MPHDLAALSQIIDAAFEDRASIETSTTGEIRDAVETTLNLLDRGELRVAEKKDGDWVVNQWAKKAVLLFLWWYSSIKLSSSRDLINSGVNVTLLPSVCFTSAGIFSPYPFATRRSSGIPLSVK